VPEGQKINRVDLGDGDWIDITTKPNHSRVNRLYVAWQRNKEDTSAYLDVMAEVILSVGVEWGVKADDGHEAPLTAEGIGSVDFAKVMAAFEACKAISEQVFKGLAPNS
jgi:hypothetical protein